MVTQTLSLKLSGEQYLKHEETAEQRSEYHNGELVEMAGGSINHNRIIRNLSRLLEIGLEIRSYEVFVSDYRAFS